MWWCVEYDATKAHKQVSSTHDSYSLLLLIFYNRLNILTHLYVFLIKKQFSSFSLPILPFPPLYPSLLTHSGLVSWLHHCSFASPNSKGSELHWACHPPRMDAICYHDCRESCRATRMTVSAAKPPAEDIVHRLRILCLRDSSSKN